MESSGGPEEQGRKGVVFSIMRYLQDQIKSGQHSSDSVESLEVALDCIGQVYHLDLASQEDTATYSIEKSLEEIFSTAAPSVPSSSAKRQAEAFKTQGNVHIKNGEVDKAVECYSKAIELDPTNATYFCNRAAGLIKQQKLDEALEDCRKSLVLNPDYARAHGRMGYVYSTQGQYAEAKKSFTEATRLDPENASYKENLTAVEQQLGPQPQGGQQGAPPPSSSSGSGGGRGMPGLGGMNIGSIISNPRFMNMASTLMSQPGFQQLAGGMMQNMAGGNSGPEGMMPQVMQMAQEMQQNNPELFQNLQQQAQGLQQQNQQNPSQPQ